jgi:hypothetical protein
MLQLVTDAIGSSSGNSSSRVATLAAASACSVTAHWVLQPNNMTCSPFAAAHMLCLPHLPWLLCAAALQYCSRMAVRLLLLPALPWLACWRCNSVNPVDLS